MQTAPATLGEFFQQTRIDYRVYDMGRGIHPLDAETFQQFESATAAYPYPLQQQAWLGILGRYEEESENQFIWFLKFPLDERGLLVSSTRDGFLAQLLQAPRQEESDEAQLSPYGFKPREDVMAAFHAMATHAMGQPPSRFYDHARSYFAGEPGYDQWAFVGVQGIADVIARLEEADNTALLNTALPQLPAPALSAVCGFLENSATTADTAEILQNILQQQLEDTEVQPAQIAAVLRAFSRCSERSLRDNAVRTVLQSSLATDTNLLAAIAARNWESLQDEKLSHAFCEALAQNTLGQDAFTQIMADLLYLPGMRSPLLAQLRNPERSDALAQAVGAMFKAPL